MYGRQDSDPRPSLYPPIYGDAYPPPQTPVTDPYNPYSISPAPVADEPFAYNRYPSHGITHPHSTVPPGLDELGYGVPYPPPHSEYERHSPRHHGHHESFNAQGVYPPAPAYGHFSSERVDYPYERNPHEESHAYERHHSHDRSNDSPHHSHQHPSHFHPTSPHSAHYSEEPYGRNPHEESHAYERHHSHDRNRDSPDHSHHHPSDFYPTSPHSARYSEESYERKLPEEGHAYERHHSHDRSHDSPHHSHDHPSHFHPTSPHSPHYSEEGFGPEFSKHSRPSVGGPVVKVFCKANTDYNLALRHDGVVLIPANKNDESQHWIWDQSWGTRVRDVTGQPAFALINKASNQALKHAKEAEQQVLSTNYHPGTMDESILWTQSEDMGGGFRTIRMANNINLNLDAFKGDKKCGGVRDGTPAILFKWKKQENQIWKIMPL